MKALVLSGGSSYAAYHCGVLDYLVNKRGASYDVISGVSAGAINGAFLAMYDKKEEQKAVKDLIKMWMNINNSSVSSQWFLSYIYALWKDSFYNNAPLKNTLLKNIDVNEIRKYGRKISIGATSLTTGKYRSFTQDHEDFLDVLLASAAYPMGLPSVEIEGERWTDGGVKHLIPLQEAIDFGADEIDVIICFPADEDVYNGGNVINVGSRAIALMSDRIGEADLKITQMYNKLVECGGCKDKRAIKLNIIRPKKTLSGGGLNFDHAGIVKNIMQGFRDAKEIKWL